MAKKFTFDWDKISQKVKEERDNKGKKKFKEDERFWKPSTDDSKHGLAVIRFLPPNPDYKCDPYVTLYDHFFHYMDDGQKKWWVRGCSSTIGRKCKVCQKNWEYYESAFESDKDIARKRKRNMGIVANVYIITDPLHPENEGKVKLYKYGVRINDKIMAHWLPTEQDLMDPDFKQFIAFDPDSGANFKIKVKPSGDYPNYDDSAFSPPNEFMGGDQKKIDAILAQTYDLNEFLAEDKFPTDNEVIETLGTLLSMERDAAIDEDETPVKEKKADKKKTGKKEAPKEDEDADFLFEDGGTPDETNDSPAEEVEEPEVEASDPDLDDDEAFFSNLGKD